ncbi:MAG: hypothetical protein Q7S74_00170 [Nanoarchaeota archaeon]|nr:hypothetical protein [Nanoarchaeota archaeon]
MKLKEKNLKKDDAPKSLFGSLKSKIKPFSSKDRRDMWEDKFRCC